MKKHSFVSGMLTMALIVGLGMSALAATGQVYFNASALSFNGTQVSAKGENYTLANGQSVPASITYTDEKGGGTTYLPVRRISELLGVETGWDGATGSVTVKGEVKAPETTTPPTDYSDWSKEDEAAYQEFKGMWEIAKGSSIYNDLVIWRGDYVGTLNYNIYGQDGLHAELKKIGKKTIAQYVLRMAKEIQEQYPDEKLYFELYGRDVIEGKVYPAPISGTSFLIDGDTYIGLGFGGL